MEDKQIVSLYWARNPQAIDRSQEKYGPYCLSIARNILRQEQDAEESVNDTWLGAWNAMPPQRPSVLSAFLGRITRNLSLDRYKAARAEKRGGDSFPAALDELSECVPAMGGVEQTMDERELGRAIDRFLRTVPEKQCSLFLRRYWYAESISQIAARYSMKENTVKSVLFRTREQLRAFLQKEGLL